MSVRRVLSFVALLMVVFAVVSGRAPVAEAQTGFFADQNIASHTFYRLDPASAAITVTMEATVGANQSDELETVLLLVMPEARDVVVRQEGTPLILTDLDVVVPGDFDDVRVIEAKLLKPLKGALTADIEMSYLVTSGTPGVTTIITNAIETPFVSQGIGSFVSIDMPEGGDNFVDPGCLKAASQPGGGYERWVCGETLILSLSADDPELLERCARLDNRCRQSTPVTQIAFAQSVTDPALLSHFDEQIAVGDRQVSVQVQYFKRDAAWAQAQFDTAKQAFPLLESLFGYPYPHERIVLRQSNYIGLVGAAGVAFSNIGEVLITNSGDLNFDREVTVHELSHQWAGNQLETSWLWEGQAEYATQTLAPQLGISLRDRGWDSYGYTDPLARWWNGSSVTNPNYWYGKSGAFWFAYASAIGGAANMTAVLAQVDDNPDVWPLDGKWFMDAGERVSGANLDSLFLDWVYPRETASDLIAARRAAWDARAMLIADAGARGLSGEPAGLIHNLDEWNFAGAMKDIGVARAALETYDKAATEAAEAGLPVVVEPMQEAWAEGTFTDLRGVVDEQRNAIRSIVDSAAAVVDEPADSFAHAALDEARAAYAEGRFQDAGDIASHAVANAANMDGARRMIAAAEERQSGFSANLFTAVGLYGRDPAADLQAARDAYASGRGSEALMRATAAYDAWGAAEKDGMFRLAIATGASCALLVLGWHLIGTRAAKRAAARREETRAATRSTWRDMENTK